MRTRQLAVRAATLALAAGGLMVIPASPAASYDCNQYGAEQYNNQGTRFSPPVPVRHGSNEVCNIVTNFYDVNPDIHCAKQVDGTQDDWIFFYNEGASSTWGWVRESKVDVFNGDRWVAKCFTSGLVHITQHPLQ